MSDGAHLVQMSLPDLLQSLQTILSEVNVVRADLTAPTVSKTQLLYSSMLREFGFSIDALLESEAANNHLPASSVQYEHPELYVQTNQVEALRDAVALFFQKVGHSEWPSFGLMDLMEPEAKRTRRFLAAMVNFWQFCNAQYEEASRVKNDVARTTAMKAELQRDVDKMRRDIDDIRKSNAEDAIKKRNLEEKSGEMVQELEKLKEAVKSSKAEADLAKSVLAEDKAKEERLEQEVEELRRQEESVRAVIRNEGELAEMQAELDKLRRSGEDQQAREKALDKRTSEYQERQKDLEAVRALLKSVVEGQEDVRKGMADLDAAQRKLQLKGLEKDDMEARIEATRAKLKEWEKEAAAVERKWSKRREMKKAELDELTSECDAAKRGLSEDEILSSEYSARCDRAARDLKEASEWHAQRMEVAHNETIKILEAVKARTLEIVAFMEDVQQRRKKL